jgi:hypothetical protein
LRRCGGRKPFRLFSSGEPFRGRTAPAEVLRASTIVSGGKAMIGAAAAHCESLQPGRVFCLRGVADRIDVSEAIETAPREYRSPAPGTRFARARRFMRASRLGAGLGAGPIEFVIRCLRTDRPEFFIFIRVEKSFYKTAKR